MFFFMYAVSDWLCVVVHFDRDGEFYCSLYYSPKRASLPLLTSSSFSLHIFIHRGHLRPALIARLSVTVKKRFNMPAFINHS